MLLVTPQAPLGMFRAMRDVLPKVQIRLCVGSSGISPKHWPSSSQVEHSIPARGPHGMNASAPGGNTSAQSSCFAPARRLSGGPKLDGSAHCKQGAGGWPWLCPRSGATSSSPSGDAESRNFVHSSRRACQRHRLLSRCSRRRVRVVVQTQSCRSNKSKPTAKPHYRASLGGTSNSAEPGRAARKQR